MLLAASWISLRTTSLPRKTLLLNAVYSIVLGGVTVLLLMTQGVLSLKPWYSPSFMIPLGGMIFANCMNSISLSAERLESELKQGQTYENYSKRFLVSVNESFTVYKNTAADIPDDPNIIHITMI